MNSATSPEPSRFRASDGRAVRQAQGRPEGLEGRPVAGFEEYAEDIERRWDQVARKNRHELLRREGRRWRRPQLWNALAFSLLLAGVMLLIWWGW